MKYILKKASDMIDAGINKVTVLGAGYMGSAITFPISNNAVSVALWGTWLDDEIISSCKNGDLHPKLKRKLNSNVISYYSDEIKESLIDTDLILIAVSSEGFIPVFRRLIDIIDRKTIPIISLTKGFVEYQNGIMRISDFAKLIYREKFGKDSNILWGSVGGPVKAVELSNKIPTATIIGSSQPNIHNIFKMFQTDYYRVSSTKDQIGLEVCSALKNVYAIAGGICDGVYSDTIPDQYHNLKSALFMQSIEEMAFACGLLGGDNDTAYGLAGTGDLYVTVSSGRNSLYGKRIGKGENSKEAYHSMLKEDKLAEGYNTLRLSKKLFSRYYEDISLKMPLLNMLYKIIFIDKKYSNHLENLMRKLNIKKIK